MVKVNIYLSTLERLKADATDYDTRFTEGNLALFSKIVEKDSYKISYGFSYGSTPKTSTFSCKLSAEPYYIKAFEAYNAIKVTKVKDGTETTVFLGCKPTIKRTYETSDWWSETITFNDYVSDLSDIVFHSSDTTTDETTTVTTTEDDDWTWSISVEDGYKVCDSTDRTKSLVHYLFDNWLNKDRESLSFTLHCDFSNTDTVTSFSVQASDKVLNIWQELLKQQGLAVYIIGFDVYIIDMLADPTTTAKVIDSVECNATYNVKPYIEHTIPALRVPKVITTFTAQELYDSGKIPVAKGSIGMVDGAMGIKPYWYPDEKTALRAEPSFTTELENYEVIRYYNMKWKYQTTVSLGTTRLYLYNGTEKVEKTLTKQGNWYGCTDSLSGKYLKYAVANYSLSQGNFTLTITGDVDVADYNAVIRPKSLYYSGSEEKATYVYTKEEGDRYMNALLYARDTEAKTYSFYSTEELDLNEICVLSHISEEGTYIRITDKQDNLDDFEGYTYTATVYSGTQVSTESYYVPASTNAPNVSQDFNFSVSRSLIVCDSDGNPLDSTAITARISLLKYYSVPALLLDGTEIELTQDTQTVEDETVLLDSWHCEIDVSKIGTTSTLTAQLGDMTKTISIGKVKNGYVGSNGWSQATINLYKRSSTEQTGFDGGQLIYYFSTGGLTGSLGTWSRTVPSGSEKLWVISASAFAQSTSDDIEVSDWTTPAVLSENGTVGQDGYTVLTVLLYQRSTTTPTKPTATATYNFETHTITGVEPWTLTVPTGTAPVWVISATASTRKEVVDDITADEWSEPQILVQNGTDGKDADPLTITKTSYTYGNSDTGTTKPSSFSADTKPVNGKYYWTKTSVTYSDNTTTDTYSVAYVGSDGQDGTSVTIKEKSVKYANSTSGTSTPSSWVDTPSPAKGQYLWTKTYVKYSDGNETTTYSVAYVGNDGLSGTSPKLTSQSVDYQNSTSGTTIPTGTWSTSASPAKGQYLWARTTLNYSDSTKAYAYSVSYTAKDGENGSAGKSMVVVSLNYTGGYYSGYSEAIIASKIAEGTNNTGNWSLTSTAGIKVGDIALCKCKASDTGRITYLMLEVEAIGTNSLNGKTLGETTGVNGTNGSSITISSKSVQYASSTSGTSTPSSWSNSPAPTKGQYLWTKTYVKYSDNTENTSYSVAYVGSDGKDGTSVTIISKSVQYATSTSGTSIPSSWSDTASPASGKYLWSKTYVKYSDGNETTTYSVSYIGTNGTNGKDYWQTKGWVDLSSSTYDVGTWYPVRGTTLPTDGYAGIKVVVQLNSGTKPSWSTHSSGFSVDFHIDTQRSGWGTTSADTIIYSDNYSWCTVSPVSYTQLSYGSVPILYLRGGGKYYIQATYAVTWTIEKDGYTWTSGSYTQTASPATSRPTPMGRTLKGATGERGNSIIVATLTYTGGYYANYTEATIQNQITNGSSDSYACSNSSSFKVGDIALCKNRLSDSKRYTYIMLKITSTSSSSISGTVIGQTTGTNGMATEYLGVQTSLPSSTSTRSYLLAGDCCVYNSLVYIYSGSAWQKSSESTLDKSKIAYAISQSMKDVLSSVTGETITATEYGFFKNIITDIISANYIGAQTIELQDNGVIQSADYSEDSAVGFRLTSEGAFSAQGASLSGVTLREGSTIISDCLVTSNKDETKTISYTETFPTDNSRLYFVGLTDFFSSYTSGTIVKATISFKSSTKTWSATSFQYEQGSLFLSTKSKVLFYDNSGEVQFILTFSTLKKLLASEYSMSITLSGASSPAIQCGFEYNTWIGVEKGAKPSLSSILPSESINADIQSGTFTQGSTVSDLSNGTLVISSSGVQATKNGTLYSCFISSIFAQSKWVNFNITYKTTPKGVYVSALNALDSGTKTIGSFDKHFTQAYIDTINGNLKGNVTGNVSGNTTGTHTGNVNASGTSYVVYGAVFN